MSLKVANDILKEVMFQDAGQVTEFKIRELVRNNVDELSGADEIGAHKSYAVNLAQEARSQYTGARLTTVIRRIDLYKNELSQILKQLGQNTVRGSSKLKAILLLLLPVGGLLVNKIMNTPEKPM